MFYVRLFIYEHQEQLCLKIIWLVVASVSSLLGYICTFDHNSVVWFKSVNSTRKQHH